VAMAIVAPAVPAVPAVPLAAAAPRCPVQHVSVRSVVTVSPRSAPSLPPPRVVGTAAAVVAAATATAAATAAAAAAWHLGADRRTETGERLLTRSGQPARQHAYNDMLTGHPLSTTRGEAWRAGSPTASRSAFQAGCRRNS
jgi:hypothetical protein